MASFNDIWYRCTTPNVTKTIGNKKVPTNACNNSNPTLNVTAWTKVGETSIIDLTPSVFATAFNENLNFKIGDYYADSQLQKVFKCVGNLSS
jgi:hypothetical protein